MRVLITGGTGFVGQALARSLLSKGHSVKVTGLQNCPSLEAQGAKWLPMPNLAQAADWSSVLAEVDAVVHLAAIAHRFKRASPADRILFDRVNHQATRALAQAIRQRPHIRRFVFMSSVRVHGGPSQFPVREDSPMAPVTPYDQSKVDGENAVRELLAEEAVRWVIVRPVVIYGPGNRGNMAKLEFLLRKKVPVPLRLQENRRSFLFLGNVVSAIEKFLDARNAPTARTWLLADEEPASTEALVRNMAEAMRVQAKFLRFPEWVLSAAAKLGDLGQIARLPIPWNSEIQHKLLDDFWVDISAIKRDLDWRPPFSLSEGIRLTYSA